MVREVKVSDGSKEKQWHVRRVFPTVERNKQGKIIYEEISRRCEPETDERVKELGFEIAATHRRASDKSFEIPDSVAAFLKTWLNDIVKNRLSMRTFEDYKSHVENHLIPHFGELPLLHLSPLHVQNFYGALEKQGKLWLVSKIHATLRAALYDALRLDLILKNPCRQVVLPKIKKTQPLVFSVEEAKRFLRHLGTVKNGLVFELMIYSGMRVGEALGLRWEDVNFNSQTISIKQAVVRLNTEGSFFFKEPKTALSKREIPIPEFLIEKLRVHRAKQIELIEYRKKKNYEFTNYGLVFCARFGSPLSSNNLARRDFKAVLKAANLPEIKFSPKVLRHVHASLLLASGESIKDVQERLGHSKPTTTLSIYSHTLPNSQKGVTERFSKILEQSVGE